MTTAPLPIFTTVWIIGLDVLGVVLAVEFQLGIKEYHYGIQVSDSNRLLWLAPEDFEVLK